jgi:hypothetical protein
MWRRAGLMAQREPAVGEGSHAPATVASVATLDSRMPPPAVDGPVYGQPAVSEHAVALPSYAQQQYQQQHYQ